MFFAFTVRAKNLEIDQLFTTNGRCFLNQYAAHMSNLHQAKQQWVHSNYVRGMQTLFRKAELKNASVGAGGYMKQKSKLCMSEYTGTASHSHSCYSMYRKPSVFIHVTKSDRLLLSAYKTAKNTKTGKKPCCQLTK